MSQDQTQKRARRPEGLSKGFRPVTFSTANGIVTMPKQPWMRLTTVYLVQG
jgi:hypothetical protein